MVPIKTQPSAQKRQTNRTKVVMSDGFMRYVSCFYKELDRGNNLGSYITIFTLTEYVFVLLHRSLGDGNLNMTFAWGVNDCVFKCISGQVVLVLIRAAEATRRRRRCSEFSCLSFKLLNIPQPSRVQTVSCDSRSREVTANHKLSVTLRGNWSVVLCVCVEINTNFLPFSVMSVAMPNALLLPASLNPTQPANTHTLTLYLVLICDQLMWTQQGSAFYKHTTDNTHMVWTL